jgi:hypothetical protein
VQTQLLLKIVVRTARTQRPAEAGEPLADEHVNGVSRPLLECQMESVSG